MTDDAATSRPRPASTSPELLAAFQESGFEPVTVTIADLVTVHMDARYQVLEVALRRLDKASSEGGGLVDESQVEAALREAFNEALRQVMEHNAAHLTALLQGPKMRPPAATS